MEETKEKKASIEEFSRAIQELLREDLVGFVCEQGVESFSFCLAGGKKFRVLVKEE